MRQSVKRAAVLLALLMVFGSVMTAGAQELSDEELLGSLQGLEQYHARTASADFGAMTETGPAGNWVVMMTGVADFDSEENAAAGAALFSENGIVQSMLGQSGDEQEAVDLDVDFDNDTSRASNTDDTATYTVMQSVAQKGELVYLVMAWVVDHDPTEKVTSLLAAMHDADPSDDPEVHNADGTSTGGLWAVLPSVEEMTDDIDGLTVIEDSVEFPVQDASAG